MQTFAIETVSVDSIPPSKVGSPTRPSKFRPLIDALCRTPEGKAIKVSHESRAAAAHMAAASWAWHKLRSEQLLNSGYRVKAAVRGKDVYLTRVRI